MAALYKDACQAARPLLMNLFSKELNAGVASGINSVIFRYGPHHNNGVLWKEKQLTELRIANLMLTCWSPRLIRYPHRKSKKDECASLGKGDYLCKKRPSVKEDMWTKNGLLDT